MADFKKEFLDPNYWHPKCANFQIIDWDKFNAQNPTVPKVFNPVQRDKSVFVGNDSTTDFTWWNRSAFNVPEGYPEWAKPQEGKIDDANLELLRGILGPNPDSSKVPEPFRNRLFWMENNEAPEELVSFNRGAWRSNTKEGRVVGLTSMCYDWTNSTSRRGYKMVLGLADMIIAYQVSPDGKWIKMFCIPPGMEGKGSWLTMYIVQEGDEFIDTDGNPIADMNPGDILRLTYEGRDDPYECDHSKISFTYRPQVVAVIDDETGEVTTTSPNYERLLKSATSEVPQEIKDATKNLTDPSSLSLQERWDLQVKYISNTQRYLSSPPPPTGDCIENL